MKKKGENYFNEFIFKIGIIFDQTQKTKTMKSIVILLAVGLFFSCGTKKIAGDGTGQSLVGSEMISKSLPPIRAVKLIHNAREDKCKALIMKTLTFDISNLAYKQEVGSEIFLKLDGVADNLKYTFAK